MPHLVGLRWRIAGAYLGLILALLLGLELYGVWFVRSAYLEQLESQLLATARVAASDSALSGEPPAPGATQALAARLAEATSARITLVGVDGTPLGDSAEDPRNMENHAGRAEVAAALAGRVGRNVHRSATVGYEMLYVAVPIVADGRIAGAARAAAPLSEVERAAGVLARDVATAGVVAATVAVVLAVLVARATTEPLRRLTAAVRLLEKGRLTGLPMIASGDEIGELSRAFAQMIRRLGESFDAVSAERSRLAAILNTMADGLVICSADGRVQLLNPAAERLLRVKAERAEGRPFIEVCRDYELAQLLARSGPGSCLVELGHPRRHVRAVGATIPGQEGQRLLLLQDVSELRRLEKTRRDFVANVSHELRTPLASIKVMVETLQDGALDDPVVARDFVGRVHAEVDAMAALVAELLELSRLESGQVALRLESVDLGPLLETTVERLQPLAQRAGLELRLERSGSLPTVRADPERVRLVLTNLVHNAIKFTPSGQVVVGATAAEGAAAVSVRDTGIGIAPDEAERIFERFYKTDRSRSGGGAGLGLAIAKHLVQAHGGRIWAQPASGGGSVLTFTLPAVPGGASPHALAGAAWQES